MPRTTLTDKQWRMIAPILPGKPGDRGRSGFDNRKSLEGMIWVLRTGAPWRDMPSEFGNWNSVYRRFRRWSDKGVFERIFETTQGELDMQSTQIDGSFIKVHQHASGAPKAEARPISPRGPNPLEEVEAGRRQN